MHSLSHCHGYIARQGHWMLFVINGPSVLILMLLHAPCVVDRTLKSNYKLTCLLSFFFNLFLRIAKTIFSEHICMQARIAKLAACLQQQWTHSHQVWLSITLPPRLEEGCPVWSVSFASGPTHTKCGCPSPFLQGWRKGVPFGVYPLPQDPLTPSVAVHHPSSKAGGRVSRLECILCLRHFVQSGDQGQLSLLSIRDMQCLLYMCAARFLTAEHVYQSCSLHCACTLMLFRKYGSCRVHVIVCPVTKQNNSTLCIYDHWCCVCVCVHVCAHTCMCVCVCIGGGRGGGGEKSHWL